MISSNRGRNKTSMERFRRLQDGRNSQYSSTDTYRIEHNVSFAQGAVEVREYAWADPKADTWTCASHFLDFSLAPRPASTWAGYLDEGQIRNRLGRIKFVPAGRTVRSGGVAGKHRSMHCLLSTEMFDNLLPNRPSWDAVAVSDGLCLSGRDIEWLLYKIYGELKHSSFAAPVVVESFATALAVALIRKFHPGRLGARAPRSGGLAPWRMRRIRDRVYGEQAMPSLSELAEVCGMSVRHLSRAFKFETGETIA